MKQLAQSDVEFLQDIELIKVLITLVKYEIYELTTNVEKRTEETNEEIERLSALEVNLTKELLNIGNGQVDRNKVYEHFNDFIQKIDYDTLYETEERIVDDLQETTMTLQTESVAYNFGLSLIALADNVKTQYQALYLIENLLKKDDPDQIKYKKKIEEMEN